LFEWSTALHEYSRPRKDTDMDVEDDVEPDIGPGGDMVSSMISQAVIPRLCKLIEGGAFDPYSTNHVRRMIDVAEQVEASVEHEGVRFQVGEILHASFLRTQWRARQALLKSVSTVFRDAVTSTQTLLAPSFGPTNPGAPFDPQSMPARRRFLMRRLKLLANLVKWRKYTGEKFGVGELATVLVKRCMVPVAERGWEVGGEDVLRKVSRLRSLIFVLFLTRI
jgi:GC-rich sequence DNA-binding factor